jgi:exosortase E/protease (VPEID-CTERM system)
VSISLDDPPNTWLVWPTFPARLAGLVGLLVIELLTLTVSVDTEVVTRHGGRWAALLGQTHHILTIAVAVAMATVLLGGGRLRDELGRLTAPEHRPGQALSLLVGHLAAFGGFAAVTAFVLGGDLGTSTYPGGWIAAWVALGLVSMAFWGAVALPMELWVPLLRRITAVLLTGVVVGLAAWAAGLLTLRAWGPLGQSTLWTVRGLLGLMGCDVVCDRAEFLIGTRTFQVEIAPACSGYEGIGLVWVFLGAYLWYFRQQLRFPQALLLIPLGTAVIWLANAVRIAALVVIGTWVSADIAAGGFHSQAGWLAFNAVALGLVLVSRRTRFFAKEDPAVDRQVVVSPTVATLAPLFSIVAVTMISGAFTIGFDAYYPLRVLAAAGTLYYFRGAYAEIRRIPSWQSVAVGTGTFAVWMALEPIHHLGGADTALASGLAQLPNAGAMTWLAFRMVGSVITVPIAEELAFRGYLIRRLVDSDFTTVRPGRFTWLSFVVSSMLFGALHGRWLAGTLAGMAYALALYRRGEIVDAIVAHATTNALIAGFVLATGNWSLWS